MAPSIDGRLHFFDGTINKITHIDRFAVEMNLAGNDPRYIEQVINESHKVYDLTFHHPHSLLDLRLRGPRHLQQLDAVANWRQRISQLVSQHCQEFILLLVGNLKLLDMPLIRHIASNLGKTSQDT